MDFVNVAIIIFFFLPHSFVYPIIMVLVKLIVDVLNNFETNTTNRLIPLWDSWKHPWGQENTIWRQADHSYRIRVHTSKNTFHLNVFIIYRYIVVYCWRKNTHTITVKASHAHKPQTKLCDWYTVIISLLEVGRLLTSWTVTIDNDLRLSFIAILVVVEKNNNKLVKDSR